MLPIKFIKEIHLPHYEHSTLQQTASGRYGFGASRTMQIAQRLYQGIDIDGETIGLITYMRTDGTNISKEAILDFRKFIENIVEKNICLITLIHTLEKKLKMLKRPMKQYVQQIFKKSQMI